MIVPNMQIQSSLTTFLGQTMEAIVLSTILNIL